MTPTTKPGEADLTDAQVDRMLSASIPGGSAARDWFLPHEHAKGLENVRDVVRRMVAALGTAPATPVPAGAPGSTDAERAEWLADKIVAGGDYAKEAAWMLRRWPVPASEPAFYINPKIIDPATGQISNRLNCAITWSNKPTPKLWSLPVYLATPTSPAPAPATQADAAEVGRPGYKLVPIEPTEAMLVAGQDAQNRACYQKPQPVGAEWGAVYYRAMVNAAAPADSSMGGGER